MLREYGSRVLGFFGVSVIVISIIIALIPHSDLDKNGCYTPETIANHEGAKGCVDFTVGYTYTSSKGNKFIDQKQDYTAGAGVYIPVGTAAANIDLSKFNGKNVSVSGTIQEYDNAPQITVTNSSQVGIYQ